MNDSLRELRVLALDCQASGATPAHGDLLELGWGVCGGDGVPSSSRSVWVRPRTSRPVSRAIRELTGWTPALLNEAVSELEVWAALREDAARVATESGAPSAPTVIHFARFELPFLRDLHTRLDALTHFPFDPVCLHVVAARLFPDLPRRNIRALAGYLGHSPGLLRSSVGHVAATAFIWGALVPQLAARGVESWSALKAFVEERSDGPRRSRRVYPLAPERRRALPDRPGVYRFIRRNGDVLYVGKATSLKKRVASHFSGGARATERALEMLTQVHDIVATETPSILEAALLESDEIKRIDPPYNVQLRSGERSAWFSERTLLESVTAPDPQHPIGPLPSEGAVLALGALSALAAGAEQAPRLQAMVLAVPMAALPDPALFDAGLQEFLCERLAAEPGRTAAERVRRAGLSLWLERGRCEPESPSEPEDTPTSLWDLARVRRRLERNLVQSSLLLRRARWLCLLADADVAYRERDMDGARALCLAGGRLEAQCDLDSVAALPTLAPRRPRSLSERKACFDAAIYDRLRVLATELRRVQDEGGQIAIRIGRHLLQGERLVAIVRAI